MEINERTANLLDIEKVLEGLSPITPYGLKLKSLMVPFEKKQKAELQKELDRIEKIKELIDTQRVLFVEIRTHMRNIKDLKKSVENCISGVVLSSVEFFEIKNLVGIMRSISESQSGLHWNIPEKYKIRVLEEVEKLLDPDDTGLKTFYIYDSYSKNLKEIRERKAKIEKNLELLKISKRKEIEKETNLELRTTGDITISRKETTLIKKLLDYPKLVISSETYINITFKIRPDEDMAVLMKEIEEIKETEVLEEMKILEDLSKKLAYLGRDIIDNMDSIGQFDLLIAKAYLANALNGVKPIISENTKCIIKNGRHPVVEKGLRKKGKTFTPISVDLDMGVAIITGANMGGKTVSLKMVGLLMLMMQYGLFVPAENMESSLLDFIFISAGDEQSLDSGLSTFGSEMKSMKEMLYMSDMQGMILIDELARGTNPREGFAISAGIINYLMKKPCITLITTHFDGLVKESIKHLQVKGLRNVDYEKVGSPEIISEHMDYTLIEIKEEAKVPKDAINISRLIGIPEEILDEAERIMDT
ncbi:MAG: DNA mismatch repair protein MutS [Clostridiales bacterium]|nr:DNA mismatch repair protein MutS [Clostridiales bacterium]